MMSNEHTMTTPDGIDALEQIVERLEIENTRLRATVATLAAHCEDWSRQHDVLVADLSRLTIDAAAECGRLRAERRKLLAAFAAYMDNVAGVHGGPAHYEPIVSAFLAARAQPEARAVIIQCPACGEGFVRPGDDGKLLPNARSEAPDCNDCTPGRDGDCAVCKPPAPPAERFWLVTADVPGVAWSSHEYTTDDRFVKLVKRLGPVRPTIAEAEADGIASGLPRWTGGGK